MIVSTHAAERYVELVKPQLDLGQAHRELEALLPKCETIARPPWISYHSKLADDEYLQIADGVVAIVCRGRVKTVINEPPSAEVLARRNSKKARRRSRRSGGLRGHGHGRPAAQPEEIAWPS